VVFENENIMKCSSAELLLETVDAMVVSAGKLRKLWDSLSEQRSSLCERRLERTVKTALFTQFFLQV
jgi:hypothetical protein